MYQNSRYLAVNVRGTQWPEKEFDKIFTPVNQTFTGQIGLLQGFQKWFA